MRITFPTRITFLGAARAFDVSALDFVLFTHAGIDHSELIPRFVHNGFRGPVYCTEATAELLAAMLPGCHVIEPQPGWRAEVPGPGEAVED